MENILLGALFLHLLHNFSQVSAFPKTDPETFVIHYLEGRRIIPVRIELNSNAQTELVTSIAGETLYDFNQGKVAYKDFSSNQCFIMDIVEESLEKDRKRIQNLQNGIVRGFYLPTFIVQEDLSNTANLTENFGIFLAEFCTGNTVSFVMKQTHRKKRDTSGEKGQFTHHSYGHYGHQSNNYAHYGHETRITGAVDENGQIRNPQVNHQQIRSESSHVYPRPAHRNVRQDFSSPDANAAPRPVSRNGKQDSATDPRMGSQSQWQNRIPSYQQTFEGGSSGIGGSGQFSLQSSHEGGYQLNLPLGLQAGNSYRGGIRSGGHYGVAGLQPQIRTGQQQYPHSTLSTGYQPFDQTQPLPPVARPSYPSTLREVSGVDRRKIPNFIQPDISVPAMTTGDYRPALHPAGLTTSDTQIPLTATDRRHSDIDDEYQPRKQVDYRRVSNVQITPPADGRLTLPHTPIHPPSSFPLMRSQFPSPHTGIGLPSIHGPSGTIQSPLGIVPGQISTKVPSSDISDMQSITRVSRPSQIRDVYPDLSSRQQHIPSGIMPEEKYLQTPDVRQPTGYRMNGDIQARPVSPLLTPGTYPGYPSLTDADKQQATQVSFPGSVGISRIPPVTMPASHDTIRNGIRYPGATHAQTDIKDEHPNGGIYPGLSRVPIDSPSTSVTRTSSGQTQLIPEETDQIYSDTIRDRVRTQSRPGELVQDPRFSSSIPSRGIISEAPIQTSRRTITGQTGFESSRIFGQDSASSQTQIQTGLEGTAAEASAAGNYGGLGSQTQVQGGYAGNGSFSAQAQSGFTGGVVQSQIQGGKRGGLSGSSSQVERVGSAQSQVQILQPSGSASSTAQGRFTGGSTQVQAQSSKTGGSAGAQAQSTGLSSSHVQVNIGGKDVNEDERFQGTISASVHGSQSSGQSQTQLQGGYDSGRTYAATAQGGFDTASGFQAVAQPEVSLTNFSSRTLDGQQPIGAFYNGERFGTLTGSQQQLPSVLNSRRHSGREPHQVLMPGISGTEDSRVSYPSSAHEPSRLSPPSQSLKTRSYPGYPTETIDRRILPPSPNAFPEQSRFDERGVMTSGFPQTSTFGIPEQRTRFDKEIPVKQDRTLYEPNSQKLHPSLPAHTLTDTPDQHYVSRALPTYPQPSGHYPSQSNANIHPSNIPTFPSRSQQPGLSEQFGLQSRYQPSSHISHRPQFLTPSSQIIPSHKHREEIPVLTRPDGGLYIEPTHRHQSMPDVQPEQPQHLFSSPRVHSEHPREQIQPHYPPVPTPRPHIQTEQTHISPSRPQIRPEQPELSSPKPSISNVPLPQLPETTEIKQDRMPGVLEPDEMDCCKALRDLKRRCCGATSKQGETSQCCRSSSDDIFDFSSENDLQENKEPCKVVKAICYIVYKPVGKARVCKPTATNTC